MPEGTLTRGRYVAFVDRPIATGGMASICFGRVAGSVGFSRVVAIKRMHPHLATERDFAAMFVDEARLVSRIRHANVVPTLDVVAEAGDLWIVMEYVHGESLSRLSGASAGPIPVPVALAIGVALLRGLHAAHEARDERGKPLGIVHRDVSPQNVMIGVDGLVRVVDFGVAKATDRLQTTKDGRVKGKLRYMAPEQLLGESVDRRADVYAASVVLWELLVGRRWIALDDQGKLTYEVAHGTFPRLRGNAPDDLPGLEALDALLARGTAKDASARFATALEMAEALQAVGTAASAGEIGAWVERGAGDALRERAAAMAAVECAEIDGPSAQATVNGVRAPSEVPTANVVVTGFSPAERRPRRWPIVIAVIGGVAMAGVAFAMWPRASAAIAPATTSPPASASVLASASVSATASIVPVPSASTAASGTATASVTAIKPRAGATGKPRVSCDPPYVVEPNGTKRYRPECL